MKKNNQYWRRCSGVAVLSLALSGFAFAGYIQNGNVPPPPAPQGEMQFPRTSPPPAVSTDGEIQQPRISIAQETSLSLLQIWLSLF